MSLTNSINLPYVSCVCPTFGRFPHHGHLLAEAVASFVYQDYPLEKRQLIILNDCPQQSLKCSVPNVHVINLPKRIESLGEKYNVMIEYASGDVIFPWEDDDVSLFQRISQGIWMLRQMVSDIQWGRDSLYWKPPQVWFEQSGHLYHRHAVGVRHHASCFTRSAWYKVGKYSPVSGNQDAEFDRRLGGDLLPKYPNGLPPHEWNYIYRWGVSPNHLSGFPNIQTAWEEEGKKDHAKGTYHITPCFTKKWSVIIKAYLEKHRLLPYDPSRSIQEQTSADNTSSSE